MKLGIGILICSGKLVSEGHRSTLVRPVDNPTDGSMDFSTSTIPENLPVLVFSLVRGLADDRCQALRSCNGHDAYACVEAAAPVDSQ